MVEDLLERSSWGVIVAILAVAGNIGLLFALLVLACAAVAVYFLLKREWVGSAVAAFVAVVLAVFLL